MLVDYTVIGVKSQSFLSEAIADIIPAAVVPWLPPLFNDRFIFNALKSLKLIVYKISSPESP